MATKPKPKPAAKPAPKPPAKIGLPPASVRAGGSQGKIAAAPARNSRAGFAYGDRATAYSNTPGGMAMQHRSNQSSAPKAAAPGKSPSILDQLAAELSKRFGAMTGPGQMSQGVDLYKKAIADKYGPNRIK